METTPNLVQTQNSRFLPRLGFFISKFFKLHISIKNFDIKFHLFWFIELLTTMKFLCALLFLSLVSNSLQTPPTCTPTSLTSGGYDTTLDTQGVRKFFRVYG